MAVNNVPQRHDPQPPACDALLTTGWRSERPGTAPVSQPVRGHLPTAPELEKLQAEVPGYRIWREVTGEHIRLVAVARTPGARPHTVVTADISELRDTLRRPASP
jgi:hypothetical protein